MNDGKFDFGFAVEWMRKDLSICIAESRRNGANLPVTAHGRSILFRSRENGRQALGHVKPAGTAAALSQIGSDCVGAGLQG